MLCREEVVRSKTTATQISTRRSDRSRRGPSKAQKHLATASVACLPATCGRRALILDKDAHARMDVTSVLRRSAARQVGGKRPLPLAAPTFKDHDTSSESEIEPRTAEATGGRGRTATARRRVQETVVAKSRQVQYDRAGERKKVTNDPGVLSFLESRTVQAKTEKYYDRMFQDFMTYCQDEDLPNLTTTELDRAATEYLDHAYETGKAANFAEKLIASIQFYCPSLAASPKHALGRTRRAAKGFVKLAPHRSRVPLPWEWAGGMATLMWKKGQREECMMLLLQFDTYARPSALLRLRGEDLLAPVAATGLNRWALMLSPQERGEPTKTGTFDETVAISGFDIDITAWLSRRKKETKSGERLFRIDAPSYRKAFTEAADSLGLSRWDWTTYQARHGGATSRPVEEVGAHQASGQSAPEEI